MWHWHTIIFYHAQSHLQKDQRPQRKAWNSDQNTLYKCIKHLKYKLELLFKKTKLLETSRKTQHALDIGKDFLNTTSFNREIKSNYGQIGLMKLKNILCRTKEMVSCVKKHPTE